MQLVNQNLGSEKADEFKRRRASRGCKDLWSREKLLVCPYGMSTFTLRTVIIFMSFPCYLVRNLFAFSLSFVFERRAQSQWNLSLLLNLAHSVSASIRINYDSPFSSKTSPTESVKISPTLPMTMVHLGPDYNISAIQNVKPSSQTEKEFGGM